MWHPSRYRLLFATAVAIILTNLYLTRLHSLSIKYSPPVVKYTYIGDSYPIRWELPSFSGPVEMTFHESEAYALDGPLASALWTSNRQLSTHAGYIRLGPDHRIFAVSMFHQLHCINVFRSALVNQENAAASREHVQHCLAYLRQFFLCAADDTLEPGDFATRQYSVDRAGHTRVCRDWSALYDAAKDNWDDWIAFHTEGLGRHD